MFIAVVAELGTRAATENYNAKIYFAIRQSTVFVLVYSRYDADILAASMVVTMVMTMARAISLVPR